MQVVSVKPYRSMTYWAKQQRLIGDEAVPIGFTTTKPNVRSLHPACIGKPYRAGNALSLLGW